MIKTLSGQFPANPHLLRKVRFKGLNIIEDIGQSGSINNAEERKRMKEFLTAPFQMKKPPTMSNQSSSGDMDNKYKDTLGFGTPNIRPNKNLKGMNQTQIKSHLSLQRMVGNIMAGGKSNEDEERDSNNFKKVTARDFFKRTREAEIEFKSTMQYLFLTSLFQMLIFMHIHFYPTSPLLLIILS